MRPVRTMAVAGALALTVAACGGAKPEAGAPGSSAYADGKTFVMAIRADPGDLDPHFTALVVTAQVNLFLYDQMLNQDSTGKPTPGLAEKWEGDTTKATYTLRQGITCADGTPLTASDVAANINFVGDPANKSSRLGSSVPVKANATADDAARTVTVTSPSADAFLVQNVGSLPIVCAKGMKDRSLLKTGSQGTGQYTLTESVASDHYTLTRRKEYAWGPDGKTAQKGLPDKVVLRVLANESTSANLLLSREVNAAALIGPDAQRVKAAKPFQRDYARPLGMLWFNQGAGQATADESVRRALAQALDLDQLGKVLTSGNGQPATGLIGEAVSPCKKNTVTGNVPGHDVAAARSALDAAGWKAGADGIRGKDGAKLALSLLYPASLGGPGQSTVELMQKTWTELGVEVTLNGVTDAQLGGTLLAGQGVWNAALAPFTTSLPGELVPFLSGPTPPDGNNFANINNSAYSSGVQAASAKAGDAGCPDWLAAESALFKHVDMVPFVNTVVPMFGVGAEFETFTGVLLPFSIRMLA